jgi:DNA invertase Pin-like site-specific DNA recombinase
MKTAVGYTRVSSTSQASPEKSSLSLQAEKIKLQARIDEYDLVKIYEEKGVSGATNDRDVLKELMSDAEARKFDAVYVWDISRFGRNLLGLKQNTERLKQLGINFVSVYNGINMARKDASGELYLNILASIYEFELENIISRTRGGRDEARRKKEYFPGKTAYGYRWNEAELRVETVPDEAAVVKRIFHEYIYLGKSTPAIAEGLQNDHIPTRSGGKWSDGYIHKLLHKECYRGSYVTNTVIMNADGEIIGKKPAYEWVCHECEPLISQEDWDRLQSRLENARAKFAGAPNPESEKYLADGLLRCGLCGGTMRLRHTRPNKNGTCHSYYECYWHNKSERAAAIKGKTRCTMPPMPASKMDRRLFHHGLFYQLGLVWDEQYKDKVNPSIEPELERARQRVENIQNALKTNKIMIANNDRTQGLENFDPLKYNTRNSELTQEGVNLQRELVEAAREYARYQKLFASEEAFKQVREDKSLLEELRIKLNALSIEEKRRLLQGLVDGDIVIDPDFLDFFESDNFDEHVMNIMKVRSQIPWKYNPAIIQEVLGVIIPNVYDTT